MGYDMTGTVKMVMDPQTFNSGFSKREFVITVEDGKFPQDICFECVKERMSILDGVNVGDQITVSFDIRGREYNGRYFNNLNAWKLSPAQAGAGGAPQSGPPHQQGGGGTPSDSENPAYDEGGNAGGYDDPF